MARLVQLDVADPPGVWTDLGFTVDGSVCTIDGVRHALLGAGEGRGITCWNLADLGGLPSVIDGLATTASDGNGAAGDRGGPSSGMHPNGVLAIDHLVVATPDIARTTTALESAGLVLRRERNAPIPSHGHGRVMRQSFFKLGDVILEVIGPPEPGGNGPARFLGLAFTSADLDATAAYLGARLHPAKPAVQPGRLIATLDRSAGTSVAMAFMTPEPA
jgi:hypothetical protein